MKFNLLTTLKLQGCSVERVNLEVIKVFNVNQLVRNYIKETIKIYNLKLNMINVTNDIILLKEVF